MPTAFGEALELLTTERDRIAQAIEERRLQTENVLRTIADGAMAPSLPRYLYRLEREAAHLDVEQRRLTVPTTYAPGEYRLVCQPMISESFII